MGDREIDEGDPQADKHQNSREFDALGKGTDDESRGDHGKRHLEDHVGVFGNHDAVREGRHHRIRRDTGQKQLAEPADVI